MVHLRFDNVHMVCQILDCARAGHRCTTRPDLINNLKLSRRHWTSHNGCRLYSARICLNMFCLWFESISYIIYCTLAGLWRTTRLDLLDNLIRSRCLLHRATNLTCMVHLGFDNVHIICQIFYCTYRGHLRTTRLDLINNLELPRWHWAVSDGWWHPRVNWDDCWCHWLLVDWGRLHCGLIYFWIVCLRFDNVHIVCQVFYCACRGHIRTARPDLINNLELPRWHWTLSDCWCRLHTGRLLLKPLLELFNNVHFVLQGLVCELIRQWVPHRVKLRDDI